jgi:hypothetical protein
MHCNNLCIVVFSPFRVTLTIVKNFMHMQQADVFYIILPCDEYDMLYCYTFRFYIFVFLPEDDGSVAETCSRGSCNIIYNLYV